MNSTSQQKLHPNKEAFIEGVDHVLARWTALGLAVEHSWGGRRTEEKREDMVDEIVNYFDDVVKKNKAPEPLDLQEMILDIVEEDFNISLEDESEREVAAVLCKLFAECKAGNFVTVDRLAAERDLREAQGLGNPAVKMSQAAPRPDGADMSDDSDSCSESDSEDSDADMEED
ncbi:rRNA accumulation- protein [Coemansia aciculifera]|uniref:rRNA accumulation- protein n=1 Tax=Coemansia aciculifera TaxID=417176 RepID=A0ACC1M819_9FUNG|nr:rRNA accumulation- protein [Coemansia aciculifera]